MKLSSNISKRVYAWLMLLPFLSIFLINISCTVDNITQDWSFFAQKDNHHQEHSHGHGHDHSSHEHDHNSNKSDEEDDDGCCSDETAAFFASVQAPTQQVTVDFKSSQFTTLYAVVNSLFLFENNLELYSDKRPPPKLPPKIPDIRIFIQSFQI